MKRKGERTLKAYSVRWKEITEGIRTSGPENDHLRVGGHDPEHPKFLTCVEICKKLRMKQGPALTHAMASMHTSVSMRRLSGFDGPVRTAHLLHPVKHPGQCQSALVFAAVLWFTDWYAPSLPHKDARRVHRLHPPFCPCEYCLKRHSGISVIHNAGVHVLATGISRDGHHQTVVERLLVMQSCSRLILGQKNRAKMIEWDGKNLTMTKIAALGDFLLNLLI
jgi:hypothetical protein